MSWRNLVSGSALRSRIGATAPRVQVVDASWHLPNAGRNAREEFERERLPGAIFFDLDACVPEDPPSSLPHMMPPVDVLERHLGLIGLDHRAPTVVYDCSDFGIFSSARLWLMLKASGMQDVAVLDGGFKAWKSQGYETNTLAFQAPEPRPFKATAGQLGLDARFCSSSRVLEIVDMRESGTAVLDARPAQRFSGEVPEPRPGLKQGHIPKSMSIPFASVLDANCGTILSKSDLESVFQAAGVDLVAMAHGQKLVFSCGSGVTACVPLLAAVEKLGVSLDVCAVYDGAFSEWGLESENFPVVSTYDST